ncbi:MAG: 5-formyltetrahydrofolate cyclo-ligase [Thermodesulfovibrionales bacterium]|nr:5-formyltetrahydrofolate cyclo-ligase [Thermodesulfovibrionales bacterium]
MKKLLRRKVLEKRGSIPPYERKRKDVLIMHRLFNIQEFKIAKAVLFYASFRTEVDTTSMIEESLKMGKWVLVPKVDKERYRLRLYEIKDTRELSPGYMGIPEPSLPDERLREINDVDLVIIPGVCFNFSGNRLGYGAGYYDILLSDLKKSESTRTEKVPFIALAYKEQLVDSIPSELHDIKVDIIVTDEKVIKVR